MAGSSVQDLDVDSLCQEYVSGQSTLQAPKLLAEGIQSGAFDLLKVVEALGVFLTSTNVENRSQGTRLLSEVLSHLHSHTLTPDEVHYVVVFYCDRLKDRAVVIPAVLYGIQALVGVRVASFPSEWSLGMRLITYQKLQAEDVINVSRTIFKEVHNQSLQHTDRRMLFNIMDTLLSGYLESAQAMGSDFVLGYIQALDGEKDPRNLIIGFNSVFTIVRHLPFEVLAEDLFEVTSCYFPIDFTPPPNDPHGISREELILGLRKCLTATPKFAEFCLPLLLEKLSSDVQSAKLDSLLTLIAGVEVFGAAALKPYLEPIWFALRNEAFQSVSEEVEAASLQAVTAVVRALSRPLLPSGGGRGPLEEFLEMVQKDCWRYLREPELRLMRPAGCLLQAAARASDPACVAITSSVVPLLLEQLTHQTQVGLRRTILVVLLEFVEVAKSYSQGEEVPSPLLPYKDSLLALLLSLLGDNHAQLRVAVIAMISGLVGVAGLLEAREVGLAAEHLLRMATGDMDSTVRRESSTALSLLARLHPAVVREGVLRPLLATLTTATPMETDDPAPPPPRAADHTHLIAAISTHHSIVSVTLPALLDYLQQLARELYSTDSQELARTASDSARTIVERSVAEESCTSLLHESIAPRVFSQCVTPSVASPLVEPHVLMDGAVVGSCAALLKCYAQSLDVSLSQSLLKLVLDVFVRGSMEQLPAVSPAQSFAPLDPSSPAQQTQLVALLTATIGALRPSVLDGHYPELLPPFFQLGCRCLHAPSRLQAAMTYASLINKMEDGPELAQVLDRDTQQLWDCLSDSSCSSEQVTRALTVWLWLTKALVMRSHPTSRDAAIKLVSLCASPSLGPQAADGFQLILSDTLDILNSRCHANIRLMHRQLFFTVVVPEIVQQFHQAVPSTQCHLLQALAHVMQGVPKQVLLGELPSLLPLLLESLGCEDDGLRLCSLEALLSLTQDAPQAISEHMHTLVPRLLGLARTLRSMKVRIAALQCVGVLTTLPHHVAYPHKQQVLTGLAPCLDDRKRLARKEAVKSRSDWFLLGAL